MDFDIQPSTEGNPALRNAFWMGGLIGIGLGAINLWRAESPSIPLHDVLMIKTAGEYLLTGGILSAGIAVLGSLVHRSSK